MHSGTLAQAVCCHAANWQRFAAPAALWLVVLAAFLTFMMASVFPADAQEHPRHRLFGFAGDVTVDGEPIPPGAVITVTVDGVEIGRAEVNAAGAWVLDIDSVDFDEVNCNLVFEVDGLRAVHAAADCPRRVRLALSSDSARANGGTTIEMAESSADELDQADSLVRPSPPRTGGGGLADSHSSAPFAWPRAAAITALLIFAAAFAALLLSRRSDGGV